MQKTIDPIIRLDEVSLSLASRAGPVQILDRVSLSILPGESVGILGPSGSGKSSMLMIMAGLERASSGRVTVAGTSYAGQSESALARLRGKTIGIVFQSFHLVPTMTALENVALPLELAGARDATHRATAALADVGLAARAHHLPAEMSGGEQQRVAIARAMVVEPAILLADEPTGNLDAKTGAGIIELLFDLRRRQGMTLVLITHDPSLAARCDRSIAMRDGRVTEAVPASLFSPSLRREGGALAPDEGRQL
jgi:putative ABC transport system ATP-binding protein